MAANAESSGNAPPFVLQNRRIASSRTTVLTMHGGEAGDWDAFTDLEGHNKYFGWYRYNRRKNTTGEFAQWADERHRRFPERRVGISEYGAGANIGQHEDNPRPPGPDRQWHPEEYQAYYHKQLWKEMKERPCL